MQPGRSRTTIIFLAIITAAFAAAPVPGGAIVATGRGSGDLVPMPGELVLTDAQRAQALAQMPAAEREARSRQWASPGVLPVAYAQTFARVDYAADGSPILVPVSYSSESTAAPNFRIASLTTAGSGDNTRYDLYISIGIVRRTCSGCYEWAINAWADWSGTNGLDPFNSSEESFGVAWAGGLYLHADTYTGEYMPDSTGTRRPIDIYRSDAAPNAGVGWSFHEWRQTCGMGCFVPVDWANGTAYIRQDRWQYRTDNAVMKYHHTYTALTYALSFSTTPGITISPTADQWGLAAYASFSH
jgi:hypothetical protein